MFAWSRRAKALTPVLSPLERPAARFPLSRGECGEQLVLLGYAPGLRCAQRLRELGMTEGKTFLLLKDTDPVLLALDDSRIAIERSVVDCIEVGHAQQASRK